MRWYDKPFCKKVLYSCILSDQLEMPITLPCPEFIFLFFSFLSILFCFDQPILYLCTQLVSRKKNQQNFVLVFLFFCFIFAELHVHVLSCFVSCSFPWPPFINIFVHPECLQTCKVVKLKKEPLNTLLKVLFLGEIAVVKYCFTLNNLSMKGMLEKTRRMKAPQL